MKVSNFFMQLQIFWNGILCFLVLWFSKAADIGKVDIPLWMMVDNTFTKDHSLKNKTKNNDFTESNPAAKLLNYHVEQTRPKSSRWSNIMATIFFYKMHHLLPTSIV